MTEDAQDVTSETPADEAAVEQPEAVDEVPAADETAAEPVAEDAAAEPVAEETVEEPVADDAVEEPAAEAGEAEEPVAIGETLGPVRVARVYVCERGHRTTTLWGEPETCQARPVRSGPECGLQLYHITELPEQVQKALNPLKASKKASKKS